MDSLRNTAHSLCKFMVNPNLPPSMMLRHFSMFKNLNTISSYKNFVFPTFLQILYIKNQESITMVLYFMVVSAIIVIVVEAIPRMALRAPYLCTNSVASMNMQFFIVGINMMNIFVPSTSIDITQRNASSQAHVDSVRENYKKVTQPTTVISTKDQLPYTEEFLLLWKLEC